MMAISAFMLGCVYNAEEDLVMKPKCDTDNISYSQDVAPLIQNRCLKCHAGDIRTGGVNLEGYDQMLIYVDNGRLVGAIKQLPGFSPMPQNEGMLSECNIETIDAWIAIGAPNN